FSIAFHHLMRARRRSHHDATTDTLTGLGNRRKWFADMDQAVPPLSGKRTITIGIFDLDGFKAYNDTYGHPAGDALLARLGRKLAEAVAPSGTTYRMGGDEFCALIDASNGTSDEARARAARALSERGRGFDVGSSHGAVRLPEEA